MSQQSDAEGGCWEQLLVLTLTRLAVGHEAVSGRAETPVAPGCVQALMLAGISPLTLIDVWWCRTHTSTE